MSYYLAAAKGFVKTREFLDKIGKQTGFGETAKTGDAGVYAKLAAIMNIVLGLVGILATIYLIYSGIKWLRSGGSEEMIKEAKDGIRSALIGLLVVFGGYVLVNFIIERLISAVGAIG
ncbi:MAG: hypothetical protein A3H70_04910 [Candidatus Komeilibacteria bacterium RIFCSPLOWO2_02_FULL_48_11]|uniref:Uncharacterized protein n=1 Tax=Candidatus Komeilibacteria bacterium RIFCSPLOWO2_02_FULL_48_11 TaxID=1798553 RepID=A0A1G2BU94_9BACT|nr:MAG: hypothetical protein A3H70_04910 [Candidatus Komeilibacteria bacterium RIFCSPLOWO2_02_FULL_48_11]